MPHSIAQSFHAIKSDVMQAVISCKAIAYFTPP